MYYSRAFIHTYYETPKEAETPSHILLLRASYISPVSAGIYTLLPLGHRVAERIKTIIREEMDAIGGQEMTMPVLNPAELWKKTGRYHHIGQELFRFNDRKQREMVLAMTHEEIVTDVARQFIRSYRDLPVMLYQIQTKVRDEARPRAGLLRVREFTMKDAYSFHADFADLDAYYPAVYNAYLNIFARCDLPAIPIEADTGIMGGTGSHEFMLQSPYGEDRFVTCSECLYRANTEKAVGEKALATTPPEDPDLALPEEVSTPGVKTIAELTRFFGVEPSRFLKTVAYEADGSLVLAVVRGDLDISETKLANCLRAVRLELASEDTLLRRGLQAGFLSPVGVDPALPIVVDDSVEGSTFAFIAGANKPETHLRYVRYGRDFQATKIADITEAREGDRCVKCGRGRLVIKRGIELGHTFKLGTKYTAPEAMDVTYLDRHGLSQRVVMGCYGIGVERLMAAVVERWHDEAGIVWPWSVAPYHIVVVPIGQKPQVVELAERCYRELSGHYEVLLDDRNESPGVKFKDADLIGIPIRVVASQRLLERQLVEIKVRKTSEVVSCAPHDLLRVIGQIAETLRPSLEGLPYMS